MWRISLTPALSLRDRGHISPLLLGECGLRPDVGYFHHPLGMVQCGLQGIGKTALNPLLDHDTVDDDVDVMLLLLVQLDLFGQLTQHPIDDDPGEPLLAQLVEFLLVLPLAASDHGRQQGQPGGGGQGHDLVHHLGDGLGGDLLAARGAVGMADAGEQKAQIVVDLRDRADGGAGVLAGGLLFDGDGRGESFDGLHVRLFHLLQELAGVGREGFHVAALPFGVDGIEGQGGLAGA